MQQCPRCGKNVNPGARFCPHCAYDISQAVQGQAQPAPQMMQSSSCPNCGAAVAPNAKFCPNCATPIGASASPAGGGGYGYGGQMGYQGAGYGAAPRAKSSMPIIIGAIVLVLLIGGGLAAYFLFFSSSGSPSGVVKSLVRAYEKGDVDATYDLMSKDLLKRIGVDRNNAELMKQIRENAAKQAEKTKKEGGITQLETKNEKIDGDRATVEVTVKEGNKPAETNTVKLVKEDGKWKVDELPGTGSGGSSTQGGSTQGGSTQGGSATGSPGEVARGILQAMKDEEWDTFNELAAAPLRRDLNEVMQTIESKDGIDSTTILNEQIGTDRATVRYQINWGDGTTLASEMVIIKEGGSWKVTKL